MTRYFSYLTILFLLALSACGRPQPGDMITLANKSKVSSTIANEPLSGRSILLKSDDAYLRLSSYVGTISLDSTARYRTKTLTESREGEVVYQSPNQIRLEGTDSNGDLYVLVDDGYESWKSWPASADAAFERSESIEDDLYAFSGLTQHLSVNLPGFLLGTKWSGRNAFLPQGRFLPALATGAELSGTEDIDGHPCYKIKCQRSIATWVLWVDKSSFLIRQMDMTSSGRQMANQRQLGGGGRSGEILSTSTRQRFTIEETDADINGELFAPVTFGDLGATREELHDTNPPASTEPNQ